MIELIDSHAHLDDEKFDSDREEIISKIKNDGIKNFITAGYSLEGSKKAVKLAEKYDFIYATCGISPNDIPQDEESLWKQIDEIENLVETHRNQMQIDIDENQEKIANNSVQNQEIKKSKIVKILR